MIKEEQNPDRSGPDRGRKSPPGAAQHVLVAVVQPVGDPVRPAAAAAVPHQLRFELNGLDSTIKQIFSCLTLLEAAGLASQQAYLPVAVGDRKAINGIFFGHASLLPPHRYRVSAGHGGVCAAVPPVHQHSAVPTAP